MKILSSSAFGGAGSAAISGIASLIGNSQQSSNIDKQIRAQQEENRKNREYNLMLARQQNAWNVEQWERENEYNDPSAQMERYKKAGLNPNLIYGNGASSISASSPMLTAGSPSEPVDMSALGQKPTLGQALQTALNTRMQQAQIDAIEAQTEKTKSETTGQGYQNEILRSDASFRDAWNKNNIDLQYVTIKTGNKSLEVSDAQIAEMRKSIEEMDENMRYLSSLSAQAKQNTATLRADELKKMAETDRIQRIVDYEIDNLVATAGLSRAQAKRILDTLPYELMNLFFGSLKDISDIQVGSSIISLNKKTEDRVSAEIRSMEDTQSRYWVDVSKDVLGSIINVAAACIMFATFKRNTAPPIKIKGFSR